MAMSSEGAVVAYFQRDFADAEGERTDKGSLRLARQDASEADGWAREKVHGVGAFRDDGSWRDEGNSGRYNDMVVDGDQIYISHYDGGEQEGSPGILWVSHWDGTEWLHSDQPDFPSSATDDLGRWNSIALDADGNPAVSYYDARNQQLKFAWRSSSGAWSAEVVDAGDLTQDAVDAGVAETDVGSYSSLYWRGNEWWIAYRDEANRDLKIAHGTPGSWTIALIDGSGTDVGAWPDLLDHAGELMVAYHDVGEQDLKLATRTGPGAWDSEIVDDGNFVGADSVLVRASDRLIIVYFDGATNDIKQAVRMDASPDVWTLSSILGEEKALGFSNSAAIDANNNQLVVATFSYTDMDFVVERYPLP
jgi:hypothetical protein